MYHTPPTTAATNAQHGIHLAPQQSHPLSTPFRTIATLIAKQQPVDTTTLADLLDANPPNPYPETCQGVCGETINFLALGGVHALGWVNPYRTPTLESLLPATGNTTTIPDVAEHSTADDVREPVAAGLPELADRWNALTAETLAQLDGFTEAAFASMLRRAGAKAVNNAKKRDSGAATAAMRLPYHHRPQALTAALTVTEEELLQDAVEEHIPQLENLLERRQRSFARALAEELGVSFQAVWSEIRAQLEEDRRAAVLLWVARINTYARNVLRAPAEALADLTLTAATLRPPTSIAADVLDRAGGAAETTTVTTRRQAVDPSTGNGTPIVERVNDDPAAKAVRPNAPDAPTPGPTYYNELLERATLVDVDYVWRHNTEPARAYEPHKDLDGVRVSTKTDDVSRFNEGIFLNPDWEGQRPLDHPDGPDHDGCKCRLHVELDGEIQNPAEPNEEQQEAA